MVVLLVVFPTLGLGLLLALGPGPYIVKGTGGEPKVRGEPNELEEESECRLSGGLTQLLHGGVGLPVGN